MVENFVNKLKESPLYSVDTDNLKRTVPNDLEWAFEFEIPIIVKVPGQPAADAPTAKAK